MKFLFLSTQYTETLVEKTQLHCMAAGIEVVRVNLEDLLPNDTNTVSIAVSDQELYFEVDDQKHFLRDFSLIWKRRISGNYLSMERLLAQQNAQLPAHLCKKILQEVYDLRDVILLFAKQLGIPIINAYDPACLNKPFQAVKARELGLNYPALLLSNSAGILRSFLTERGGGITKPIGGIGYFEEQGHIMSIKTTAIEATYLDSMTTNAVFPSFIQERISSQYELKCLLVDQELYCVKQYFEAGAIPTTDIKQAYKNKQITNVAYELDATVKSKVVELCQSFQLDLCSLDIIKNAAGEYVFLEINPDGVLEYYSYFLNTSLHEQIFKMLLRKSLP